MSGWGPWERWRVARRLARHAQREGGAPPADLLRRLREDIPVRPGLGYQPAETSGGHPTRDNWRRRPGRRPRRVWVAAAVVAASITGGVIGLRVLENHWRRDAAELAGGPGSAAAGAGAAAPGQSAERAASPASRSWSEPAAPPAEAPMQLQPPPAGGPAGPPGAPPAAPAKPGAKMAAGAPPADQPVARRQMFAPAGPPPPTLAPPLLRATRPLAPAGGAAATTPPPVERVPAGAVGEGGAGATGMQAAAGARAGGDAGKPATEDEIKVTSESPLREEAEQRGSRRPAEGEQGFAVPAPATPAAKSAASVVPPAKYAPSPGSTAKDAASQAPARLAAFSGQAAPLRSSFGADTGTGGYRRVRQELAEGRLPPAASVRIDQLANAFDLETERPAASRPRLEAEGAPLPGGGAIYLLRVAAHGLGGPPGSGAVAVEFDPAVVARFRRVGAVAGRGAASALYEIELRTTPGAALSASSAADAPPASPLLVAGRQADAAPSSSSESKRRAMAAAAPAGGALAPGRGFATLRLISRRPAGAASAAGAATAVGAPTAAGAVPAAGEGDAAGEAGGAAAAGEPDAAGTRAGGPVATLVVRVSDLRLSWSAASPALRVAGLAVRLAQALAARDPAPRLQALLAPAQALAAELPGEARAAELLQLIRRAAYLASPPDASPPP